MIHLVLTYHVDLDSCTENEMIQFADLSKSFARELTNETSKELFTYRSITTKRLRDTYQIVEIALRIGYISFQGRQCLSIFFCFGGGLIFLY